MVLARCSLWFAVCCWLVSVVGNGLCVACRLLCGCVKQVLLVVCCVLLVLFDVLFVVRRCLLAAVLFAV